MVPPCALTMPWLTESPSPVPLPTSFEVKNGSKMRFRFSSGIPQPVSMIEISTIVDRVGAGLRATAASGGDGCGP